VVAGGYVFCGMIKRVAYCGFMGSLRLRGGLMGGFRCFSGVCLATEVHGVKPLEVSEVYPRGRYSLAFLEIDNEIYALWT
jgi:hypothetical protein